MTVQLPRTQTVDVEDTGTPLTVGQVMMSFMVPVKWYDDQGRVHQEFVFVVGDTVYRDPNGETWASRLKQFTPKMGAEIVERCNEAFEDTVRKVAQKIVQQEVAKASLRTPDHNDEVDVLADLTDKDVATSK